jgi:outer membrane protein TolC
MAVAYPVLSPIMRLSLVAIALTATVSPPAVAQAGDTLLLDLSGAVTRALRQADESQLAALGVDMAAARVATARATALPQVSLASSYSQVVRNARAEIVGNVFGQSYNYAANLTVSQALFQGGREVYGWRGASRTLGAARLDEREVRALLQVNVQRAYFDAVLSGRLAGIQENGLQLARDRLRQVEQLASSGRAARYDVLRARVETANLEPLVQQAASNRTLAELALRRIINVPLEQPLRLTTTLDAGSVQSMIAFVSDDQAVPDRPAVRAAELSYLARRDALSASRAGYLPTVSVFLRTGFLALPGSTGFPWGIGRTSSDLCPPGSPESRVCQNDGWFRDESFGVQVSWPLFDGLRTRSERDFAEAQALAAEVDWRQRVEDVAVEVASARAEFTRARALFDAQQSNAGEASEAFQLASLRFSRGLSTQIEVSDAQLALLTAQSNEARAVYDLHLAAAELARALGRPIPVPGAPTPAAATSARD